MSYRGRGDQCSFEEAIPSNDEAREVNLGHVDGTLPKEVTLWGKGLRGQIGHSVSKGMVDAITFIASHQILWLHLYGKDPWTMLSCLPQLTEDSGRCLMAYMIDKWRAKISWKRLYNVRNPLGERFIWKIWENTVAIRTETATKFKSDLYMNYSPWTLPGNSYFA